MADQSSIEWTDATWNPTVGCSIVSPGCTNCYAMKVASGLERRFASKKYSGLTKTVNGNAVWTGEVRLDEDTLLQPLKWKRSRRIFVNSMSDLFHEGLPDEAIDRVFAVMALCPQHTFQVLTKRAERMRRYMTEHVKGPRSGRVTRVDRDGAAHPEWGAAWRVRSVISDLLPNKAPAAALNSATSWLDKRYGDDGYDGFMPQWPLPNVWLGVSCERQQEADERIPFLLQTPAAVRLISAEPLLGPINLKRIKVADHGWQDALEGWRNCKDYPGRENVLDWIIVGGESGSKARHIHPDWARSLRDQCKASGTAFFFKQWGEWAPQGTFPIAAAARDCDPGTIEVCGPKWAFAGLGRSAIKMSRVGKKAAGRLLDGVEHSEFPQVSA